MTEIRLADPPYSDGETMAREASVPAPGAMPRRFCMVSFLGNLTMRLRDARTEAMLPAAALRFERAPCRCNGCRSWSDELDRYGGITGSP